MHPASDLQSATVKCLIVDDDPDIRSLLERFLRDYGMCTGTAASGAALKRELSACKWDVVILDLLLPDASGLELCHWIRATTTSAVIMLTAQSDAGSRIVGLELGADDYLGKPFEPRELVARIKAVLRRAGGGAARSGLDELADAVRFNGWVFDRLRRQLRSPVSVVMPLSNAEFRLLEAFVRRSGQVLTREQLRDASRAAGIEVNDRGIDLAVSRLRQKLGDSPRQTGMIITIRGEGYLFDAIVDATPRNVGLDRRAR